MATNSITLPTLPPWSSSSCHCFPSLPNVAEAMPSQKLYKLHYESSDFRQCKWFIEAAEVLRRQQAIEAIRAVQQQLQHDIEARIAKEARLVKQQQHAEAARIAKEEAARLAEEARMTAFKCRRCSEAFASNIKLHDHVRTKHTKKHTPPAPPSPPTSTPPTPPITVALPASPASPASTPTTPRKPVSWAEIASRPKQPTTPSRLPRPTITAYGLPTSLPTPPPTPSHSPILQTSKLANSITKPPSITRSKTPYLTVEDLYTMFHGKPRPASLTTIQKRLPPAPSSGNHMRLHQMRITSYFKPPTSAKAMLAPNRKHADSKPHGKSTWIGHLTPVRPYTPEGTLLGPSSNPRSQKWYGRTTAWRQGQGRVG
ncbi:MAG: hypothetical protein HETSPECPRED_001855 [Heterodermia speciosa]|uniref:C2H2-type domain-containing protein n=1 Tax=Heterodermia speciosa TaxID=116794 RepID=A0A8H3PFF5_9LECA|nr:MAG: hypothetical protein HETSPECPRED_001855 [Heterodermia speciosa]